MPRGRKKGSGAVKAAAVRREWNVGELVLAKVKGYPPWPAQIRKAEDRGWASNPDSNKIFVCFFGTEQIRFCHYGEIHPFTPRERSSLIGKLQQKNLPADFSRAIIEICKADDEQKKENQADMDEAALENDDQQEDGNLSHADDKLGATDVDGSDGRPDSHLGSPGARSSEDDRFVVRLRLKKDSGTKPDSEREHDVVETIAGNDGQRLDEAKPEEAGAPTAASALEIKPSQVGGDPFDADQVHHYRKKVKKTVEEEEKPQEVAPVVEKQQTETVEEEVKPQEVAPVVEKQQTETVEEEEKPQETARVVEKQQTQTVEEEEKPQEVAPVVEKEQPQTVEEEMPQEVAPVVEKQQTPPVTESLKD